MQEMVKRVAIQTYSEVLVLFGLATSEEHVDQEKKIYIRLCYTGLVSEERYYDLAAFMNYSFMFIRRKKAFLITATGESVYQFLNFSLSLFFRVYCIASMKFHRRKTQYKTLREKQKFVCFYK